MLSGFDIISLQVLAAEISFSYINNICKKSCTGNFFCIYISDCSKIFLDTCTCSMIAIFLFSLYLSHQCLSNSFLNG